MGREQRERESLRMPFQSLWRKCVVIGYKEEFQKNLRLEKGKMKKKKGRAEGKHCGGRHFFPNGRRVICLANGNRKKRKTRRASQEKSGPPETNAWKRGRKKQLALGAWRVIYY